MSMSEDAAWNRWKGLDTEPRSLVHPLPEQKVAQAEKQLSVAPAAGSLAAQPLYTGHEFGDYFAEANWPFGD